MLKEAVVDWIKQYRVIAIVKGVGSNYIEKTIQALYDGGIRVVEVTLNSNDALKSISIISQKMNGKMICGAGTVISADSVDDAVNAGAHFISCIHSDAKIITTINEMDRASIAGAFTPTNIVTAKENGADFINIFPSITLGPDYFRQLKSPFNDQLFIAIGGINANNAAEFLKAGAWGIGIGNNLVNPRLIKDNNYTAISDEARKYVNIVKVIGGL